MYKPFVRSPHNYDMSAASVLSAIDVFEASRTIQSDAEDADINVLVRRFGVTGQMPQNVRVPTFEDFGDEVFDFQSAMNAVRRAEESFNAMPADVRTRFNNDPQKFVEFCSDEKNLDEMRKLGLAIPKSVDIIPSPEVKGDGDGKESVGERVGSGA